MKSVKFIGCIALLIFFAVWAVLLDKYTRFGWIGYLMFLIAVGISVYFVSGPFFTSLIMLSAIQKGHYNEAIRIGETALRSGNATKGIKIDLITAYYNIGEIDKAKEMIADLQKRRLSFMEKKLIDNWIMRIDEMYSTPPLTKNK